MKFLKQALFLIVIIFSFSIKASAWGRLGHSIVAEVAFHNLDEKSKFVVLKYLDGLSIEDAANWMDEQRGDKNYDYLKPLHYINIENGEHYEPNSTNNIISELNRIIEDFKKLNTLTDEAIKVDLLELFHLIGDLHQPLHVGYGNDKGGNTYQVQFNNSGTNLHKLWDSELIEYKKITLEDVLNYGDVTMNGDNDFVAWMNESRSLLNDVYPANHKITNEYINKNTPVIERQLLIAGIRLVNILNLYFKDFKRIPNFTHKSEEVKEISIDDINNNIDKTVKICTKVYGVKELKNITFINCGAAYPNSPLTVVVFSDDLHNFSKKPEKLYDGKEICITGKLVMYKGKPEIIAKKEEQIIVK